jgi:hypothetical protein
MRRLIFPIIGASLGGLLVWLTSPAFDAFLATRWLEVHSVLVTPREGPGMPYVTMERTIHRPFSATWTTSIRRQQGAGFVPVCSRVGRSEFTPDTIVPPGTDLNYWLGIPPQPPCDPLTPGTYKVLFVWLITGSGGNVHQVRYETDIFLITPESAKADVPR